MAHLRSLVLVALAIAGCPDQGSPPPPDDDDGSWIRVHAQSPPFPFAGPLAIGDDIVVLRDPCQVDRLARNGSVVWSTASGLTTCESIAVTGPDAILVTGDGQEAVLSGDGIAREPRENEGRTVATAALDGGVSASRDGIDITLHFLDAGGNRTAAATVASVDPAFTHQHWLAGLASGDVILSFFRDNNEPTALRAVDGGEITIEQGWLVLQLDRSGAVRRVFNFGAASNPANLAAAGDAYVFCGRLDLRGELVENRVGERTTRGVFVGTSVVVHVDEDGDVEVSASARFESAQACQLLEGAPVVALAATDGFFVRSLSAEDEVRLAAGAVFYSPGLLVDETSLVLLGMAIDAPATPLFPSGSAPISDAVFVMSVPRGAVGF